MGVGAGGGASPTGRHAATTPFDDPALRASAMHLDLGAAPSRLGEEAGPAAPDTVPEAGEGGAEGEGPQAVPYVGTRGCGERKGHFRLSVAI